MSTTALLDQAAQRLRAADQLIIVAGCGLSVESGLPDFNDEAGLRGHYPILGQGRFTFQQLSSADFFIQHPRLAWELYGYRLHQQVLASPHAGHQILNEWVLGRRFDSMIFSSAVDDLLPKALTLPNYLCQHQGSMLHLQCSRRCSDDIWPIPHALLDVFTHLPYTPLDTLPCCPICQGVARPNILLFHDPYWVPNRAQRQYQQLSQRMQRFNRATVILEIGAGLSYPVSRRLSEYLKKRLNCSVVRINPEPTQLRHESEDVHICLPAAHALQHIQAQL